MADVSEVQTAQVDGGASGTARTSRSWFEARALFRLGAPMVGTQFFIMAMGFVDTAMAGHYAATHLAGVALGGNVLWPVYMTLTGCTMSVTPIIAQLVGAKRTSESGAVLRQGLYVALGASILAVALVTNAAPVFAFFGIDSAASDIADRYLKAAAFGLPAAMCYILLRFGSEGLGHTVGPMVIAGVVLVLNAVLNYAFVYGHFGAPELGGVGCGWATAIVMWIELAAILVLARFRYFRRTGLWERLERPRLVEIKRILKIGIPIGISSFVGMALFSLIGFFVGSLGVVPLGAHTIAGHINWATYVIPMSLGSAAGIRIGFYVGAGEIPKAARVARVALSISVTYAVVISATLVLLRHQAVALYTNDVDVLALAGSLILLIALYQIFDVTQGTMAGALRGYKDTRAPMLYALGGYWLLALPLGIVLGFGKLGMPDLGVFGFWAGLAAGLAVVAVAMGARLYRTANNPVRIARLAA